jgi:tetratricopeptide (TPR) repeat protein
MRARHEIAALQSIGPPWVPKLLESGFGPNGTLYMAMELVAWPTLADWLVGKGALDEPAFLGVATALLRTMDAIHARALVHRDLKPENIFIGTDPYVVRLFDFGLVKDIGPNGGFGAETRAGFVMGSPAYMAPEQCEGKADVGIPADVYALGVILFELLTGRLPFVGGPNEVRHAHLTRRPPRPSELAPSAEGFDETVLRCLAKDPARRFASVAEVERALVTTPPTGLRRASTSVPATRTQPNAKQQMVLLWVESSKAGELRAQSLLGARLAHYDPPRCVFAFGAGESPPVMRAARFANHLWTAGLLERAILDVATVTVQQRPNAPPLLFSRFFRDGACYPQASDPGGILATDRVLDHLVHARTEPVRANVYRIVDLLPTPAQAKGEWTQALLTSSGLPVETRDAFVGREAEVARLVEVCRTAVGSARSTIATVLADAGNGKTRFARELLLEVEHRLPSVRAIYFGADEASGDGNATLRQFLRTVLELPRNRPERDPAAVLGERLGPSEVGLWPALALALGWIEPTHPTLEHWIQAPGVLHSMISRAAGHMLRNQSAKQPLCILLDDAQSADGILLDALEYATLAEESTPICLIALARPRFSSTRPNWGERAAQHHRLALGPLHSAATIDLLRELMAPVENIPEKALEYLAARVQGSPLLAVELCRGLRRDGIMRQQANGTWFLAVEELDRLPESPALDWAAQRELDRLPPELAAHTQLAALLAASFAEEELNGVLAEIDRDGCGADFPLDPGVAARRLVRSGVLVRHHDGRLSLRHALVRQAIARGVPEERRFRIHRAAYRFYETCPALLREERLTRLALHADGAQLSAQAAGLFLELAESARMRHLYVEAELNYAKSLAHVSGLPERDRMMAFGGRGVMRYRTARYSDAVADLASARTIARALGDRQAELGFLLDEATALDWKDEYRSSQACVREAELLIASISSPPPHLEAQLSLCQGRSLWRFGQLRQASELLERAERQAALIGELGYETRVVSLVILGYLYVNLNRAESAASALERAEVLCLAHNDRAHLSSVVSCRRGVWIAKGNVRGAIGEVELYIKIGRELGVMMIEYFGEYNLAEVLYQANQLDAAWPHVERAIELARRIQGPLGRPVALVLKARMLAYAGRLAEAERVLKDIKQQQEEASANDRPDGLLLPSEGVLLHAVDLAVSGGSERAWEELLARSGSVSVEQEPIEVIEFAGLAALRTQQPEKARAAFERALEVASSLPNVMEPRIRAQLQVAAQMATATLRR